MNGPSCMVACEKCGAGFYEDSFHQCKIFISFAEWDAHLQALAKAERMPRNKFFAVCHQATKTVAGWPEWMRRYAWTDEFRYSVRESDTASN